MTKTHVVLFFLLTAVMMLGMTSCHSKANLSSPDKKLSVNFQLSSKGTPRYQLMYGNKIMILPSEMGFVLDRLDLTRLFSLDSVSYSHTGNSVDNQLIGDVITGGHLMNMDNLDSQWPNEPYNQMVVHLKHKSGLPVNIRFLLSNHTLAFRCEFDLNGPYLDKFAIRRMYATAECVRLAVQPERISACRFDSISQINVWEKKVMDEDMYYRDTISPPLRMEWKHEHLFGAGHNPNDQRSAIAHNFVFTHPQYVIFDEYGDQSLSNFCYLDGVLHFQMVPTEHLLEVTPWRLIVLGL